MSKYSIDLTKGLEELTEVESMILSIKGAINQLSNNNQYKAFYESFIASTLIKLEELGISKDEIFKYQFKTN